MNRVRTAVVGVGYLGRFHAQKYASLAEVDFVAVCDLDPARGRTLADELGTRYVQAHGDLVGLVDAVTIAADTSVHFELAKFFLERDVHVLVEKPMTKTSAEAAELATLAEQRGVKLQVGHIERFNPALVSAREGLNAVGVIECHRLAPFKARGVDVDVVLDLMIHDLDVILSLVGGSPTKVSAVGVPILTPNIDIANARVEFDTGAIANVTASRVSTKAERKFRVFQRNQYVSIDFGRGEVQRVTSEGDWQGDEPPLRREQWSLEKGDALLDETRAFIAAIRDDTPCLVSGRDGQVALELAEAITRDIEKRGRPETLVF
jgi:predicted dehydrogenase